MFRGIEKLKRFFVTLQLQAAGTETPQTAWAHPPEVRIEFQMR